jgi:hypothetical protein
MASTLTMSAGQGDVTVSGGWELVQLLPRSPLRNTWRSPAAKTNPPSGSRESLYVAIPGPVVVQRLTPARAVAARSRPEVRKVRARER